MRKEFGKWLMDIAKYLTTVLLLSSTFVDMENNIVVFLVFITSISTLSIGLWLVKDKQKGV